MSHNFLISLKAKQLDRQKVNNETTDIQEIEDLKIKIALFKFWSNDWPVSLLGSLRIPSDLKNNFPEEANFIRSCFPLFDCPQSKREWANLKAQLLANITAEHAWSIYLISALARSKNYRLQQNFHEFDPSTLLELSHESGNRYATFQIAEANMTSNRDLALRLFEEAGNRGLLEGWLRLAIYYETSKEFDLAIAFGQKVVDSDSSSPQLKGSAENLLLKVKDKIVESNHI